MGGKGGGSQRIGKGSPVGGGWLALFVQQCPQLEIVPCSMQRAGSCGSAMSVSGYRCKLEAFNMTWPLASRVNWWNVFLEYGKCIRVSLGEEVYRLSVPASIYYT